MRHRTGVHVALVIALSGVGACTAGDGTRDETASGAVGGTTVLVIYPEEGVVVSILTNIQNASQTGNAAQIADMFVTVGG